VEEKLKRDNSFIQKKRRDGSIRGSEKERKADVNASQAV
jgi:hypothetical protein